MRYLKKGLVDIPHMKITVLMLNKNLLDGINSRLDKSEEWTEELQDKSIEIIQAEVL
jgi:hypothetical protein